MSYEYMTGMGQLGALSAIERSNIAYDAAKVALREQQVPSDIAESFASAIKARIRNRQLLNPIFEQYARNNSPARAAAVADKIVAEYQRLGAPQAAAGMKQLADAIRQMPAPEPSPPQPGIPGEKTPPAPETPPEPGYENGYEPGYENGYEPGYENGYEPYYENGYDPGLIDNGTLITNGNGVVVAEETKYFGLTPMQLGLVAVIGIGIILVIKK